MKPVLFEKDGPLGWLTLNRPEKRNTLSFELMDDLLEKLNLLAKDQNIRIVVIRGNGPAFCAGHDLNEMTGADIDAQHFHNLFSLCAKMMQKLNALPQPVIAQVHGIATAAGLQLVASCDLAIAATDARFATPGVKIGLFCSTPAVPLVRAIGRKRTLEMLMSGRFVSAEEAKSYGLVNKIAAPDKLAEQTRRWAMELAEHSRYTLAFGKETFYKQVDLDMVSAYHYASNAMVMNGLAEDAQEGMTAFLEKRKPEWKHR